MRPVFCVDILMVTIRAARVVLFSVCLSVCLSVCQHDNSWTVKDITTTFSGHHPMVERAYKFEKWLLWRTRVVRKRPWCSNLNSVYSVADFHRRHVGRSHEQQQLARGRHWADLTQPGGPTAPAGRDGSHRVRAGQSTPAADPPRRTPARLTAGRSRGAVSSELRRPAAGGLIVGGGGASWVSGQRRRAVDQPSVPWSVALYGRRVEARVWRAHGALSAGGNRQGQERSWTASTLDTGTSIDYHGHRHYTCTPGVHNPRPAGRMRPATGACAAPRGLKESTIIRGPQWALNNSADTETVVSAYLYVCVLFPDPLAGGRL